jgi:hypothetical protein
MTIEQDMYDGSRAREILESEVYIAAFETIKQEIMTTWQLSPSRDLEGREKLFLMLGMLNKVQSTLQIVMETGKIATINLQHQRTLMERAKEFIR